MTERNQVSGVASGDAVVIEREFDAPRETVWQAWTDPEHFARWYGPGGFTVPYCTLDLRVGGSIRICMTHEQYGDMWTAGIFDEIDPPARLVYREFPTDPEGNKVKPPHPEWPDETRNTLVFQDLGNGRSRITMTWEVPSKLCAEMGALAGWNQAFDKLAGYLAEAKENPWAS